MCTVTSSALPSPRPAASLFEQYWKKRRGLQVITWCKPCICLYRVHSDVVDQQRSWEDGCLIRVAWEPSSNGYVENDEKGDVKGSAGARFGVVGRNTAKPLAAVRCENHVSIHQPRHGCGFPVQSERVPSLQNHNKSGKTAVVTLHRCTQSASSTGRSSSTITAAILRLSLGHRVASMCYEIWLGRATDSRETHVPEDNTETTLGSMGQIYTGTGQECQTHAFYLCTATAAMLCIYADTHDCQT
jgi:hypothetical protein